MSYPALAEGLVNSTYSWKENNSIHIFPKGISARYLLHAPPNMQVWHKAFVGGSRHRAGAHTRPVWPKIHSAPSASPLLGAPQAPGNTPHEGVKAWEAEAGGNLQLPRHTRSDPCHSMHDRPKCDPTTGEAQCHYIPMESCNSPWVLVL